MVKKTMAARKPAQNHDLRIGSTKKETYQPMVHRFFEDFTVGDIIDLGRHHVTAEAIVDFASQFDPAPFHLDKKAGEESMLGGLAASGWHSCAILMRMIYDSFLHETASQGAPGLDRCQWLAPVLAGTTLTGRAMVTSSRLLRSRPGIGMVGFQFELQLPSGATAVNLEHPVMIRQRPTGPGGQNGDRA